MLKASHIVHAAWDYYLSQIDAATKVADLETAWHEYNDTLDRHHIIATLAGYRFAQPGVKGV